MKIIFMNYYGSKKNITINPEEVELILVSDNASAMTIVKKDLTVEYVSGHWTDWDEVSQEQIKSERRWKFKAKLHKIAEKIKAKKLE